MLVNRMHSERFFYAWSKSEMFALDSDSDRDPIIYKHNKINIFHKAAANISPKLKPIFNKILGREWGTTLGLIYENKLELKNLMLL
jgi:hypothetical protein